LETDFSFIRPERKAASHVQLDFIRDKIAESEFYDIAETDIQDYASDAASTTV